MTRPAADRRVTARTPAGSLGQLTVESDTHCQRIGAYCALIAHELGHEAEPLAAACRLHDIGMLPAAAGTVDTAGPLTSAQRRSMQAHTTLGHALLAGSGTAVLELAAEIALGHHERFDGRGYPHGTAGTSIPLAARIMAAADAFDAVTTDRPYRRAAPAAEAAAELQAARGGQLDPRVVDALLGALDAATSILTRHPPRPDECGPSAEPVVPTLTLTKAASLLGVTPSRLRRWADDGRLEVDRTAGGHRRFTGAAVRELAAALGLRTEIRRVAPPDRPLPTTARLLRVEGRTLAAAAAGALYPGRCVGFFAVPAGMDALDDWLDLTAVACDRGVYGDALSAVGALQRHAESAAATLLERHTFLERFGQALVRALVLEHAERGEIADARRLMVVLQQETLS